MRIAEGVLAGAAGALALFGFDRAEAALLGRPTPYASDRIAERLARRLGRVRLSPRARRATAVGMRAVYGSALGVAYAATARVPRRVRPWAFGASVALLDGAVLPALGATRPVSRWSPLEGALLVAHAVGFTLVADVVLASIQRAEAADLVRLPLTPTLSPR